MKIGEFFEKHVQWIAMGLAAGWLVYVGWTYGVNRPVIRVGNETLSPGSVDEHIRDTEMATLANRMSDPNVPAGLVDVPDFTDAFVSAMNVKAPPPLPELVLNSPPQIRYITTPGTSTLVNREGIKQFKVSELPEVTPATDPNPSSGRSLVLVPLLQWQQGRPLIERRAFALAIGLFVHGAPGHEFVAGGLDAGQRALQRKLRVRQCHASNLEFGFLLRLLSQRRQARNGEQRQGSRSEF